MSTISSSQLGKAQARRHFILNVAKGTGLCMLGRAFSMIARDREMLSTKVKALFAKPTNYPEIEKKLDEEGPKVEPIATENADFLFFFTIHNRGYWFPAPEKYNLTLETVERLKQEYPTLIFCPEEVFLGECGINGMFGDREDQMALYKEILLTDSEKSFLTEEAAGYFHQSSVPMLLFDIVNIDPGALESLPASIVRPAICFGLPPLWGILFAHYFTKIEPQVLAEEELSGPDRRTALKGMLALGAGILEGCFNPFAFEDTDAQPKIPLECYTSMKFLLDFRNALAAYKLLAFARLYKKKQGKRPAFLVPFGYRHRDIVRENIFKGEDYNLGRIQALMGELGLRQTNFGETFHKTFLFNPANPNHLPFVEETEFEAIRRIVLAA